MKTNYARFEREIKSRIGMAKTASNKYILLNSKYDKHVGNKVVQRYTWSLAFSGTENWTLLKVDQKLL
jgi:hypothetical protein